MTFLGILMKILSVLMFVAGTIFCTAIALDAEVLEAYIVMGFAWALFLLGTMCMWCVGSALYQIPKLKKRIALLEQRIYAMAVAGSGMAAAPADAEGQPVSQAAPAFTEPSAAPAPKRKVLIPVTVAIVAIAAIGALVLLGGKGQDATLGGNTPGYEEVAAPATTPTWEMPAETAAPEPTVPPIPVEEMEFPCSISTGFVEMHFMDYVIAENIQHSVTVGRFTRTTGPQPIAGQQFICLSGTIINTSNAPLPVYDFFIGEFNINDYRYSVSANDCDVLAADGSSVTTIDPLMEYTFRIYVSIPQVLAESFGGCTFRFGFFDGFENAQLSYNKAFEEDPIALCPYQYQLYIQ